MGARSVHGCLDSLPDEHKYQSVSLEKSQVSTMLPLSLSFRALLVLLDPPWTIAMSWKSFMARRIIVFRVIMLPILVPCQARKSAAAARRILVISPESSRHRYEVVPVFAMARMCGHLRLVCSAYAKKPAK